MDDEKSTGTEGPELTFDYFDGSDGTAATEYGREMGRVMATLRLGLRVMEAKPDIAIQALINLYLQIASEIGGEPFWIALARKMLDELEKRPDTFRRNRSDVVGHG